MSDEGKRQLVLRLLALAVPLLLIGTSQAQHATITVSGTVTGPSGPVPDVWVAVYSQSDGTSTRTDATGSYRLTIETSGELWFHVRPRPATRLTQYNLYVQDVAGSHERDFVVTNGYLLSLRPTGTGGGALGGGIGFDVWPLTAHLEPHPWWYILWYDETSQRYEAVLPPNIYHIRAGRPPAGYHETAAPYDLRSADVMSDMPVNTEYVHPIPYDPPDASKISIGPPDDLGEAQVIGAAGAALPLAHVFLVNLNSTHQAHAVSESDGSFRARVYAPPGSAIMVKHGPASPRWNDVNVGISEGINPFPGTILNVPHSHQGGRNGVPFAAAGAIDHFADDDRTTLNTVGSAWAITGTLGPVVVEGQWTRVMTGTFDGQVVPGLYSGGLNWTHPTLGDLDGDGA